MTLTEMREQLRDVQAQLSTARASAQAIAANQTASAADVTDAMNAITRLRAQAELLRADIAEAERTHEPQPGGVPDADDARLKTMLSSREYTRAFIAALRTGANPMRTPRDERNGVLYDALTIAGGTPAGSDGGFLVPTDFDNQIHEVQRTLNPLSQYFGSETVTTSTGWRAMDTAPTGGMTALTGEITQIDSSKQPKFAKVPYGLTTYGQSVPVSNELISDESAGLMAYLSRWFGKLLTMTENSILMGKLNQLTAANIVPGANDGDTLASLKTLLNVALDPAISANAMILTNQDGFDYLDKLHDTTGRALIQPDPMTGAPMLLRSKQIVVMSNAQMPTREVTTTGATKGSYYPLYVGDGKQYATLFRRQSLELRSTDVGGSAWSTNSTEVRGIARMGASVFDDKAMVRREIFIAAT